MAWIPGDAESILKKWLETCQIRHAEFTVKEIVEVCLKSIRKQRLFLAAVCREIEPLFEYVPKAFHAVAMAEELEGTTYSPGRLGYEIRAAKMKARRIEEEHEEAVVMLNTFYENGPRSTQREDANLLVATCGLSAINHRISLCCYTALDAVYADSMIKTEQDHVKAQDVYMKMIMVQGGILVRMIQPKQIIWGDWKTRTVVAMAQNMYANRNWEPAPILADALQDAGCEDDGILGELRSEYNAYPMGNCRGNWILDAILGKC